MLCSNSKIMNELNQVLERLRAAEKAIRESGAIAPEGVTIDTHHPGGDSDQVYKRLRSKKAIFKGKRGKAKTRTFNGAEDREEWEGRISRRNKLKEIERAAVMVQAIADESIWTWL